MNRFIRRFADKITAVLSGFDRLVLRGSIRCLKYPAGMKRLLWKRQVLLKHFDRYAKEVTQQLKTASLRAAQQERRPIRYLPSSKTDKEALARQIAQKDGIREGLIAVFRCVEPCCSYQVYRNRDRKQLELVPRRRKCLHLYHYFIHPQLGFLGARIETWFPFDIQICLNGREWLARQMDHAGIGYRRQDNCFVWIEDFRKAQKLMDRQLRTPWRKTLHPIVKLLNPAHREIFRGFPVDYYWSSYQSEWATDVTFRSPGELARIYPALVLHGMSTFSSADVMRFLGRKVHGAFKGEIVSDFKNQREGMQSSIEWARTR